MKAGCDGGCSLEAGAGEGWGGGREGRGRGGYQWGMVSAAEAAGKADILIKQPRAKSH